MLEWIIIGLILSIFSGVILLPYFLLSKPWRVKKLAYFLISHWPWYRSYIFKLAMRRMARVNIEISVSTENFTESIKHAQKAFMNLERALAK